LISNPSAGKLCEDHIPGLFISPYLSTMNFAYPTPAAVLVWLILFAMPISAQDFQRQALHTGWTLRATTPGTAQAFPAQVPGTVQLQLLQDGLLPDPFYGTNEKLVQWVGEKSWIYTLQFDVADFDSSRHYQLNFLGLDTYAEVSLNGQSILQADNMFRRWQVDVNGLLRAQLNELQIHFRPPAEIVAPLLGQRPPYEQTAVNDTGTPRMANMVRKAQFHFGWDWGLRLLSVGIWRPVYLESWKQARIADVQVHQQELSDSLARLAVVVDLDHQLSGPFELVIRDGDSEEVFSRDTIARNTSRHQASVQIDHPRRWWPSGHGSPERYHLICELYRNGELLDTFSRRIGLRTVELVQDEDAYGRSFYFRINGRPIFVKGASYIPQDALLNRITAQQKIDLLSRAQAAHLNLIRVWGGGIYEDDTFYDTCDSLGLMVWQDFMFACAAYPGDEAFLANVRQEAVDNVRRLRNHPSIITWCGNNEVYMAMDHWGWQKLFSITKAEEETMDLAYRELFQTLLPELLKQEDPTRPYTHTTPTSEWWNPEGLGRGTLHYWGVWHGEDDFSGYETKVGRYMNEYGFQSFPELATIATFADSSQWALDSPVMEHHQKSYVGNGLIGKFTAQYGQPTADFTGFVEQSQRVQYEGIRRAIIAHRLHWGYCMGTTFWQLNDCWPGPSWSAIDYYGREKVLFRELPNLYAPVIAAAVGQAYDPQLAIISDAPEPLLIRGEWTRRDTQAQQLSRGRLEIQLQQPGTVLLNPEPAMVPGDGEQTELRLFNADNQLISTFKWEGSQLPIQMPKDGKWQAFPTLVLD
jgi:beta-mannosidase